MWGEKRLVPSVLPLLTQQYLGDGSQKDSPSPPPSPSSFPSTLSVGNPQWRSVHASCILSDAPFGGLSFQAFVSGLDSDLYLDTQSL